MDSFKFFFQLEYWQQSWQKVNVSQIYNCFQWEYHYYDFEHKNVALFIKQMNF